MEATHRYNRGLPTVLLSIVATVLLLQLDTTHAAQNETRKTPEYILPCKRSDPQINICIKKGFNHLRQYLKNGIPEIDIPSLDPLVLEGVSINNWDGPVRVRGFFNNITAYGPANYTVENVRIDLKNYVIDIALRLPHIEATGRYNMSGQVLILPIRSKGEFWAAFSDIRAIVRVYGKEVIMNGTRFMKTEKLGADFDLAKARFKIRDTVNENSILGEAMNQFLNQNALEIIQEMKPVASKVIGRTAKMFLNKAFMKVPIPVWLLDE